MDADSKMHCRNYVMSSSAAWVNNWVELVVVEEAGDFNQTNLQIVLPKFHQHVQNTTRGRNLVQHVYTNIPGSYEDLPRPHFGTSDKTFPTSSAYVLPADQQLQHPYRCRWHHDNGEMRALSRAKKCRLLALVVAFTAPPEQDWKLTSRRQRGDSSRDWRGTSKPTVLKICGKDPKYHRLLKQQCPIMCDTTSLDELNTFYAGFDSQRLGCEVYSISKGMTTVSNHRGCEKNPAESEYK